MAGMIRSIFGLTTEDVRQKQLEQQQEMAAQLQKQQGTSPFAATFGIGFGAELGRSLMSRLGFEDPEMAKAKEVEAAQTALDQELAKYEIDDPARYYVIGQALVEAGQPEEATRYFTLARQAEALAAQRDMSKKEFGLSEKRFLLSEKEFGLEEDRIKLLQDEAERKKKELALMYGLPEATLFGGKNPAATSTANSATKETTTTTKKITAEDIDKDPVGTMYNLPEGRVIKTESGFKPVSELTTEELQKIRTSSLGKGVAEGASKVGEGVVQAGSYLAKILEAVGSYNPQQPGVISEDK